MNDLANTKILLGLSGGIAAYKSAILARRLIDAGADVRVMMSTAACEFISPLTLQALTGHPVHTTLLDPQAEAGMGHIELARWADLVLIAPATANTLAHLAHGLGEELLDTVCLATSAPLLIAPAMNQQMWANAATQANVQTLIHRGHTLLGPDTGLQACGENGAGRMLEPEALRDELIKFLRRDSSKDYLGKHLLITAGPTREPIDPVRYISNHSSGRMGYALAAAAARRGAQVTLISGPTRLDTPQGVKRIDVESAADMHAAVFEALPGPDVFVSVAAVADYRVATVADEKIKKSDNTMQIELIRNPDILAEVAASHPRPFCVGFAAETEQLEQHARSKLQRKGLDMIAANRVARGDNPVFGTDRNALELFWPPDGQRSISEASKDVVAEQLLTILLQRLDTTTR